MPARWPTPQEVVAPIDGPDGRAVVVRQATHQALSEIRRLRSVAKLPSKTVITSAVLPRALEALNPARSDLMAAAHILSLTFENVEEVQVVFSTDRVDRRSSDG